MGSAILAKTFVGAPRQAYAPLPVSLVTPFDLPMQPACRSILRALVNDAALIHTALALLLRQWKQRPNRASETLVTPFSLLPYLIQNFGTMPPTRCMEPPKPLGDLLHLGQHPCRIHALQPPHAPLLPLAQGLPSSIWTPPEQHELLSASSLMPTLLNAHDPPMCRLPLLASCTSFLVSGLKPEQQPSLLSTGLVSLHMEYPTDVNELLQHEA